MKEYYKTYLLRYLLADAKTRKASKEHWIKCHKQNIVSGNDDAINFSARMLGMITMAESIG